MAEKKNRGMAVAAISTVPLILVLGNSMLIPILPKMKSELDISQFQVSLIITAFSVAAAVSIPFLGYLSDRFSRKTVIIPALFLYGSGGLLAGAAAAVVRFCLSMDTCGKDHAGDRCGGNGADCNGINRRFI